MKLRNLLFGTMIACAFVACSNDDDPIIDNGGGAGNADGKTYLQVNSNAISTKADTDPFTVYVIDGNGNIVATGSEKTQIALDSKAEGNVELLMLRHVSLTAPTTKADLLKSINFSDKEEVDATTSQNTAIYKVTIERGKVNRLGYVHSEDKNVNDLDVTTEPVPAYRNAARIHFNSVKITDPNKKYINPKLRIKEIFLLNARKSSKMAVDKTEKWAKTEDVTSSYLIGATTEEYKVWMDEAADKEGKYFKSIPSYESYIVEDWGTVGIESCFGYKRDGLDVLIRAEGTDIDRDLTHHNFLAEGMFFTYENTDMENPTLLVLKADFIYTNADGEEKTMSDRFYTVVMGKDIKSNGLNVEDFGIKSVDDIVGVRRNIAYGVDITVTGPGSNNPLYPGSEEETYLDAQVELVNWGRVYQQETID